MSFRHRVYIETERPAKPDSRGLPLVRDDGVLVVYGRRFNFQGLSGVEAARVAKAAVVCALRNGLKGES